MIIGTGAHHVEYGDLLLIEAYQDVLSGFSVVNGFSVLNGFSVVF